MKNIVQCSFVLLLILCVTQSESQILSDTSATEGKSLVNTKGRFKVEASLNVGGGLKNLTLGKTTENKDITISGGGGVGGVLSICYGINSYLELGATVGFQNSSLMPEVSNAEGSFTRTIVLSSLKYSIPLSSLGSVKIGGGIGYYSPGELDIDASKISGGGHNVYSYDGTVGFHLTGEYEMYVSPDFSWGLGLKYYNTTYHLKSITSNGVPIPISLAPSSIKSQTMELDGSGIDFSMFIAVYL